MEIEIPLSLLYELADDSPLKGLWNTKSVHEKLGDLVGIDFTRLTIDTNTQEEKQDNASTETHGR